ncbi:thioredoxin-like protein [Phlebopus sp. FC_14]|nr:thioredoxin-like protein [Phlebopus sp. FC_14]
MAPHPLIDKPAPSFSIPDANGETYKFLPEEGGKRVEKPVALFFYPESGTYGCTREACQFRDALAEKEIFKRSDVLVVGVSPDAVSKQKAFVEKNNLSYPVLSDTDHVASKAYSVGRGLFGLTDARTTFVIDKDGVVRGVLSATMNFNAHVKFVVKQLEKLQGPGSAPQQQQSEGAAGGSENQTPVDPAVAAERNELGRVAGAVSA